MFMTAGCRVVKKKKVLSNLLTFCYPEDSKNTCAFQNLIKPEDRSQCWKRIKDLLTKIGQASKLLNITPKV